MSTCHISLTAWKVGYLLISYLTFIRVWTHLFYMQNGSQEQKSNRDTQSSRRSVLKGSLVAIGMGGSLSGVAAGKGGKGKGKKGGGNGGETGYAGAGPYDPAGEGECSDGYKSQVFSLWAGQDNYAGTVTLSNDEDNIYVTYDTNESADLKEVHVDIYSTADAVPDKRPAPGQADYKAENLYSDAYTVTVPFADLGETVECGDDYYVIAHTALASDDGSDNDEDADSDLSNDGETAYAGGSKSALEDGKGAWFYVAEYTIVCCLHDIKGSVYTDTDSSGSFDEDESGWGGITVTLEDDAGNVVATTTTNTDGTYTFEDIPGGEDYSVVVEAPDGYVGTQNSGGYEITDLDADLTGVDFGYTEQADTDFTYNVEADYKQETGNIKFESTSKPALGEDGRSETDTFTFTAGSEDSELTVETKNQDTVSEMITPGETVTMSNGFDVTWDSITGNNDGTYTYEFTVTSDADNTTGALSYVEFDTDAPEGSISA